MKKITLLLLFISSYSWAQLSCAGAVPLTNGFTASGITTPGAGAGSPGTWVTAATLCGTAGQYHHNCFTSIGDDYVFSYTTGAVAGESVSFTIVTGINYIGLMAFTGCNGTVLDGCKDWRYSPSSGATMTVTATALEANQTVYFAVGIWSTPNNLAFNVTNFTVTPALSTDEFNKKQITAYPNPVKNALHLSYDQKISNVAIYNLIGQQVLEKSIDSTESEIDLSSLSSGNYILKANVDGTIKSMKIIKE
ncbi:T9SS type A sorting domain-containing protein [uncultured Flavobacterium sp.]|uniref:T9SS type A sorting domain-containing protein n=1 Tax=uncultured Flavobacterium sp. TaxID=165435 RepID=UPI0025D72D12|nr:T9SS type A sorting domain-containing protein [uncultured Flavobacterium sp.]